MAEKMFGRIPSVTPQVSWFEFLLDKTGKLLKDHIATRNADPSAMQLCKQFLQKCIQGNLPGTMQVNQPQGNERSRQLSYLALVVAAYTHWDLDEIINNLPLNFQYLLLTELLRNFGLTESALIEDFKPETMSKKLIFVWIVFHRWILRSIVKTANNKRAEKAKSRNTNSNSISQDDQLTPMLYGYLQHSLRTLNEALKLNENLEVPFPKPFNDCKTSQSNEAHELDAKENDAEQDKDHGSTNGNGHTMVIKDQTNAENVFDEVIPVRLEHVKMHIYADLGAFHFFEEDYYDAFKNFSQLFELHKKEENKTVISCWPEIKGCFLACAMICNTSVDLEPLAEESSSLIFKTEQCISRNFEGLYSLLREDNVKKELPLTYRSNLVDLVVSSQRKDLLFMVCACNAVRNVLAGSLLSTAFLKSLNFAKKEDIIVLIEISSDILATTAKGNEIAYLKRSLRAMSRFMPANLWDVLANDKRLALLFPLVETSTNLCQSISCNEDQSLTCIKTADSVLLETVSGLNLKDDPQFIKREIALSTNPDYLKQLVAQLSVLVPGKESFKSFQCFQYNDLLNEIRDPMTQAVLHVLITKARTFAAKQELSTSLGLFTNSLEILNQYCMQTANSPHTNRIKNIIHHEILSAKVQWEQNKADASINMDTLRLCKACYHHKEQDPLPKKQIYRDIVSYLLNNKEWQFLIDERGNTEGITDFRELGYQLANVSVGLSKAGDAVRKHANELWNTVVNIICEDVINGSQPLMAFERSSQGTRRSPAVVTKKDFISFLDTMKNSTVLSVLASCLVSIINLLKNSEELELKALYSHIWPTELNIEKTDNKREEFLSILKPLLDKVISLDPRNIAWLRNKADIFIAEGKYREAMKQYLEIGAMTSNMFSKPVPFHAWDEQIIRRMIDCCFKQKLYSQAVVLCQFVEPIDYPTVLKALQDNGKSSDLIDTTYDCLWDPTILEFLIYAHSKRGEIEKKQLAIKTISQPELNSCSNQETLKQTVDIKKCEFLRFLTTFYWNN